LTIENLPKSLKKSVLTKSPKMQATIQFSENGFYKQVLEFYRLPKSLCQIWASKSLVPTVHLQSVLSFFNLCISDVIFGFPEALLAFLSVLV
jgi:hypothetical protein